MGQYKIHRYTVKTEGSVFIETSSFNSAEREIWDNYVAFVQSLPGHARNAPDKVQIDANTMKYTYYCHSPDGKEELFARNFFREVGLSSNTARTAYMNMMRNKGSSIDPRLSYTEVEFANGHIIMLRPNDYNGGV